MTVLLDITDRGDSQHGDGLWGPRFSSPSDLLSGDSELRQEVRTLILLSSCLGASGLLYRAIQPYLYCKPQGVSELLSWLCHLALGVLQPVWLSPDHDCEGAAGSLGSLAPELCSSCCLDCLNHAELQVLKAVFPLHSSESDIKMKRF
jgi:hypothetical protein